MANSSSRNGQLKECDFLEAGSRSLHGHCVFEIVPREASRATDNTDPCAFVASLLTLVNPDFKDVLTNRLTELGIRVIHTVKLPSQAEEYMIDYHVERNFDRSQILVIFGFTILLLFKNICRGNYEIFMTKRIKAIVTNVGFVEMVVPYSYSKAEAIRSMLGASVLLKALCDFSNRVF